MFVGHLAVALGAKRAAPGVPLSALVAACFGLDLIWPVLLLAGVERVRIAPGDTAFTALAFEHYPWTHSLLMAIVWGALAGALVRGPWGARRAGTITAATVVSHWVLDWITHRPDLPLWPGGPAFGLGLWNSIPGTLIVEGLLFALAIAAYARAERPRDAIGRWAFVGLVALTGGIWVSQPFSPPPPSATAVALGGLALWLLPFWAAWIERHRVRAAVRV